MPKKKSYKLSRKSPDKYVSVTAKPRGEFRIVRSLDPVSSAKVVAGMYAVIGTAIGVAYAIMNVLAVSNLLWSIVILVISPVLYGICGLLAGLVSALLYNVIAGMLGGIRIELN
jgi:transcriptional regulator of nitric oxide reductase